MTEEGDIEDLTVETWKRENEELKEQLEAAKRQIEALKKKQLAVEKGGGSNQNEEAPDIPPGFGPQGYRVEIQNSQHRDQAQTPVHQGIYHPPNPATSQPQMYLEATIPQRQGVTPEAFGTQTLQTSTQIPTLVTVPNPSPQTCQYSDPYHYYQQQPLTQLPLEKDTLNPAISEMEMLKSNANTIPVGNGWEEIKALKERMQVVEGSGAIGAVNPQDLCFIPKVALPPKFKMPEFEKYTGSGCPKNHLTMFYGKMAAYLDDEKLLMYAF